MTAWQWAAGPWRTGPEIDLSGMTSRSMTWSQSGATVATLGFRGNDPDLAGIDELISDLWLFGPDATVLHRGRFGPSGDDGQEGKVSTVKMSAPSYKERWRHREVWGAVHATTVDPADTLWGLFATAQAAQGGDDGIVRGVQPAAVTVPTVDVSDGTKISDAGDTLAGLGGFDWDVTPVGVSGLQLDVWRPTRGANRGVVVEYEGEAASAYSRALNTDEYGNAARVTGQAPSGGGAVPAPQTALAVDGSSAEGRWDRSEAGDQTTTGALAARAGNLLIEALLVPATYTVTLRRGWWRGPSHLWLGDFVTWQCRDGRLNVEELLPVQEIKADWAAADVEPDVTLTLGARPRNRATRARDLQARINRLELL